MRRDEMTKFVATIRHHSISRARQIEIEGTLTEAKRAAAREFDQEQRDYEIAIYADTSAGEYLPDLVATRRVGGRKWLAV
jgi:hypothetical protein